MLKRLTLPLTLCLLASSCGGPSEESPTANAAANDSAGAGTASSNVVIAHEPEPLTPPAPGQPGGLPDDRSPVSEKPFTVESAQGAGQVLQTYFALIEEGKYGEAWKLRWKGQGDDTASAKAFAASFAKYESYHANVGAPGEISGAAGSLYVEIPVQIYGRKKDGEQFATAGTVTLKRINDVPGSTAEQRRWRIYSSE